MNTKVVVVKKTKINEKIKEKAKPCMHTSSILILIKEVVCLSQTLEI